MKQFQMLSEHKKQKSTNLFILYFFMEQCFLAQPIDQKTAKKHKQRLVFAFNVFHISNKQSNNRL